MAEKPVMAFDCSSSRPSSPGNGSGNNFFAATGFFSPGDFLSSLASSAAISASSSASPFFSACSASSQAAASQMLARNSTKTLKCPKCNWHYKYQETLEIHMKEKHANQEVVCVFCVENQAHPKLARGETYSCGYKPYRCELCKYSTTTKGNLSIHMQSDKHLHALQDIPQSLAGDASQLFLGQHSAAFQQMESGIGGGFASHTNRTLQCLVCLSFCTDSLEDMAVHLDRDRGQPQDGDMVALHGFFQCLLCPYSTNLKANFQLHTRTDKHLQRVQLINHLREGSALLGPAEQFARLGSLKSAVQVRCQPCQELFNCGSSLREHCHSRAHLQRLMMASSDVNVFSASSASSAVDCPLPAASGSGPAGVPVETTIEELLRNGLVPCGSCSWEEGSANLLMADAANEHAILHSGGSSDGVAEKEKGDNQAPNDRQTAVIGWQELDNHLLSAGLACHRKKMAEPAAEADGQKQTEEEQRPAAATAAAKCPFCSADPVPELCQHIAQAHNIPAEIAQRLAQQIVDRRGISGSSSEEEPLRPVKSEPSCSTMAQLPEAGTSSRTPDFAIFRHNCADCSMAFQSADQLRVHSLRHSNARFRLLRRCQHANCGELEPMATRAALEQHMAEKHCMFTADGDGQKRMTAAEGGSGHFCDICQDGRRFDSDQELMAHFNSESHLQRLANNGVQPSPLLEESAGTSGNHAAPLPGSKRRSNSAKSLPYICNVCALAFGQPGTLDTHLRSMAHAQRMGKLLELIQSGELDPKKAIFEQPEPHPPQRSIGEMAKEKNKKQQMGKMDTTTAQASMQSSSANNQLELLKADQQQQQQQMLHHLMMQMFGGAAPQPTEAVRNQQQTFSAAAQMAQMLLTAQMAAAQMASASTNGFSGFGMLDMLASRPNSKAALPQKEELNNNSTVTELDEPKAKRPRADNQQQKQHSSQQRWPSNGTAREESGPVSREGSIAPSAMPSASAGLDLASVLQALAAGANPSTMSSAFPFCPTPSATDPNVDFLMAMSAFPACTSAPPLTTATTTAQQQQQQANNPTSPSPQKRARTRIGDEQIKILRQYFDINNSPSEEHIKEMAQRTQLGEKVIKHWFRNTLFKERQRDKDSPYNFSIPPQMSIDLATYHRTGEARIMPLVKQEENKEDEEEERRNETDNINKNGDQQKLEEQKLKQKAEEITVRKEDQTISAEIETGLLNGCEEAEGRGGMSALAVMKKENDERQKHDEEEEEEEKAIPREKEKRSEGNREEEQRKISASSSSTSSPTEQEEEEAQQQRTTAESVAAVAANLLASIGQQQLQSATSSSLPPLNPFGFGPAEQFAQMFSSALPSFNSSPSPFGNFCGFAGGSPSLFNPFVPIQQPNSQSAPIASQQPQQQQPTISSSNSSAQSQPPYSSSGQQQQQHQASSSSMGSGRRANRTRFTDFQLRTLQEFFDKQAYPKDDDLEMLSKKMGLSPRVIVVWFQNARQKARKVFEQQPHLLVQQASEVQTDPRFVRTPSANFQCRCGQVFQRYQELIQHKQKVCLVAEHEKATEMAQNSADSSSLNDAFSAAVNGGRLEDEEGAGGKSALESAQEMLLRQLMMVPLQQQTGQHLEQIKPEASTHQHQQHPERPFHKRCPYCGRLFHSRDKLATHLPLRHPEQPCLLADLDLLPDADEVPGADQIGRSTASSAEPPGPLDLSLNGSRFFNGGGASSEEAREENACWRSNEASLSPAAFSSAGENEPSDLLLAQSCSPLAALLPALFQPMAANQQRPPAQPSPQHSTNSSSKRFRTHLTPIQVFVMKSLFHDYKTPSMQECDCLGQRIGLHKRVVQVWFQNARAKERKAASGNGSAEPEEFIPCCGSTQHCQLCDLPLINGQPLQEHIFGREHIEKVRERGAQLKGGEVDSVEGSKEPQGGHSTTPTPTAQQQDQQQQQQQAHQMMAQLGPLAQLPYYALAAAATGLGQPGLSPLLYDPAIFGTPVPALKVPEAVAQQILADMAQRKENSKFTQDGMELADLERKLAANDFRMASTVDLEVGWGCPQCGNMFQQLELLQNHQKLICAGVDGTFGLVQTHYQCDCCQQRFGTQEDFCAHCHSEEHKQATKAAKRRGSCALAATEPVPPAGS